MRTVLTGFIAAVLAGLVVTGAVSGSVAATPPANVTPPAISGSATVGQTLSASTGSWSGTTPITYTFQWRRCDSSGGSCSTISGAADQTYTLTSADDAHTIRVLVTATNSAGSASQSSAATAVVTSPPVNTAPPKISGTLDVGRTLSVSSGTWTGAQPITISYGWFRCDTSGGNCAPIGGATSASYKVVSADVGHRLIVVVTAQNSAGTSRVTVTAGTVGGGAPVNTAAPTVSGSLAVGNTIRASSGSWSGTTPITIAYAWERCDLNGGDCSPIGGATNSGYRITSADTGHRLIVVVTASNSVGTTRLVVTAGNVGGGAPVNTAAPTVSGSLSVGSAVSVSSGSWSGTQPISISYQWYRCDANGGNCATINATASSYTVTTVDAGHRLVVDVTAKNSVGTGKATVTVGNVGGGLPGGAVLVSTVSLPDRLVIDRVSFSPSRFRTRTPIVARFHVSETHGLSVSGALVYVLGLPYGWTFNAPELATDTQGWATITIRPTRSMPLNRRGALVLFVRARKPGDPLLGGVSTRRLVQVGIR
jgi:large repetitive protein